MQKGKDAQNASEMSLVKTMSEEVIPVNKDVVYTGTAERYPGTKNMIPFNKRPKKEHLLISSMGGRSKSIAKSEAQKLRMIKERIAKQIANPADAEWLLQKMNDRPSMAAELLLYVEQLKQDGVHPSQRIALGNMELNAAKFLHGEKIKTENVNINISTSMEEWEKRLIGEEEYGIRRDDKENKDDEAGVEPVL